MKTKFKEDFPYIVLVAILFSFFGFVAENCVRLITLGIIDSRFHILPFIGIYGLIPFVFYFFIGDPNNISFFGKKLFKEENTKTKIISNLIVIALICVVAFLGEFIVGNMWDCFFDTQLWDYSNLPLSVTQYAGLIPAVGYGLGAYLLLKFVMLPSMKFFKKHISRKFALIFGCTLFGIILLDEIAMQLQIMLYNQAKSIWLIQF